MKFPCGDLTCLFQRRRKFISRPFPPLPLPLFLFRSGLLGLTVAKFCSPASVKITDGHPVVVDALKLSSERLTARSASGNCTAGLLNFDDDDTQSELYEGYDVCLISDCLHAPDLHSKIARCVKYLLKPGGSALVFNPKWVVLSKRCAYTL